MKRFTNNELKWQFEIGVLEDELNNLLRAKEKGDLQAQEKLEKWQRKINELKNKYLQSINKAIISPSNRRPELEEKFNINLGQSYRVTFDRGPTQYKGALREIIIHFDNLDSNFAIVRLELEDGMKSGVRYELSKEQAPRQIHFKDPFDRVYLRRKDQIKTFELIGDK